MRLTLATPAFYPRSRLPRDLFTAGFSVWDRAESGAPLTDCDNPRAALFARPHRAKPRQRGSGSAPRTLPCVSHQRGSLDKRRNVFEQLIFLERLAEIDVHADLRRIVAVLLGGARRDHDDRDVFQLGVVADIAR